MHKKLSYIFASVICWLSLAINICYADGLCNADNTAFNQRFKSAKTTISIEEANLNDDSPESPSHKNNSLRYRVRFLVNRSFDAMAILPALESLPGYISIHVKQLYIKYPARKASRPGYYSFLFRLSPF